MPCQGRKRTRATREVDLPLRSARSNHSAPWGALPWRDRRHDRADELFAEGMVAMKTYRVVAKRWAHGWELHIDGVGVTQSRTLGEAEAMVRDYIAVDLDASPDDVDVELAVSLGDSLDALRQEVREASDRAAVAQTQAAERSRILVRQLRDAGLSGREIATVLDVSPQRVSQLLASTPSEGASARSAAIDGNGMTAVA